MKWGRQETGTAGGVVTWSFAQGPATYYSFDAAISLPEYQAAVRAAFATWSAVANIEFVEVGDSSASDIRLGWDELDGRGGAWAEAATGRITRAGHVEFDVEIGFDLAENWYPEASAAADLFYRIALHEIGHAIGLDHRADPTSIMNATVYADGLSAADISAVQALYGQAPAPAPGEEPAPFQEADIEVVAATYQFFTGSVPLEAGFAFLIDAHSNPMGLSGSYYETFNQENRFLNFATNLATVGEGAAHFQDAYAELSFDDAVWAAYDEIVGIELARTNGIDVDAALAFLRDSVDFYAQVAQERVVSAGVALDDAVKIVMIGSVMYEALKADVGHYAGAVDDFVAAYEAGAAVPYGTDLLMA